MKCREYLCFTKTMVEPELCYAIFPKIEKEETEEFREANLN